MDSEKTSQFYGHKTRVFRQRRKRLLPACALVFALTALAACSNDPDPSDSSPSGSSQPSASKTMEPSDMPSSSSESQQPAPSSSERPSPHGPNVNPSLRTPGPPPVGRGKVTGLIVHVKKGADREEVDRQVAEVLEGYGTKAEPGVTMFDGSFVYSLDPGFKETQLDEVSEELAKLPEVTSAEPDSQVRLQ